MLNVTCHHIPLWKKIWLPSKESLAHYKHPPASPPPPFAQWDSYKNDYTIHHMYNFRDYISASSSSYRNFRLLDPKSDYMLESLTNLKKKQINKTNKLIHRSHSQGFSFNQYDAVWQQNFESFPGNSNINKVWEPLCNMKILVVAVMPALPSISSIYFFIFRIF